MCEKFQKKKQTKSGKHDANEAESKHMSILVMRFDLDVFMLFGERQYRFVSKLRWLVLIQNDRQLWRHHVRRKYVRRIEHCSAQKWDDHGIRWYDTVIFVIRCFKWKYRLTCRIRCEQQRWHERNASSRPNECTLHTSFNLCWRLILGPSFHS